MKELTIEQKAQAYDKVREKIANEIFSEYEESEDEKIRKTLIKFHKSTIDIDRIKGSDIVAWLEKQNEQKPVVFKAKDWYVSKVDGKIHNMTYNPAEKKEVKEIDNYCREHCKGFQETGKCFFDDKCEAYKTYKQNLANNVELKFEVGNWYQCTKDFFGKGVTFDKNTAYYCAREGCLQNEYGCHIAIVKDLYDNFKLWTIQDAKDGDVLIDKSHAGECVFIFKEARPSDIKTNVNNPFAVIGYCGINHIGFTSQLSGLGVGDTVNCTYYPATKEQRDLLFQKMKEAGYEWDAEKKELKHIDARENLTLDGDLMQADCMIVEQEPAWSKEDETVLNNLIYALANDRIGNYRDEYVDWLKSLKDRIGG